MTILALGWTLATLLAAAAWLRLAWLGRRTDRVLVRLDAVDPAGPVPPVSVVVPCRNEARGVEAAVRSLLSQELPGLEVVAVDDRSTDATGAILARVAAEDPRLTVVRVDALPDGWLGKNHAMHAGAARARGAWLLFTDGDVVFGPGALRRAVRHAERLRLGHLVALPRFVAPQLLERAFVSAFSAFASFAFRVWELPRAGTRGFIGVGAFNLVRRDAYDRIGGHRRLALEVVDDVKLGLVLRRSGVPQGAVDSAGLVQVRWQHGFVASVLGLVKNAFAGAEYRHRFTLAGAAAALLLGVVPLAAALLAPAALPRGLGLFAFALSAAVHGRVARRLAGGSGAEGLTLPACAALLAGVLVGSAVVTRWRDAVVWRGTRYPLATLRAACVRVADWPASRAAGWDAPAEPSARASPRT